MTVDKFYDNYDVEVGSWYFLNRIFIKVGDERGGSSQRAELEVEHAQDFQFWHVAL